MVEVLPEALRSRLLERGIEWPGQLEHHETLPSTNDRLKEWARAGAPEWSCVIADQQTAGRGRHGREWASPPGNLYLSLLVRSAGAAEGPPTTFSLAAGVAVAEALAEFGVLARLKWPNDVVGVSSRKLAGILVEATTSGSTLETLVIGIGINLTQRHGALPRELRSSATTVAAEAGRPVERSDLAAALLGQLLERVVETRSDSRRALERWRDHSLEWWGSTVEVRSGEETLRGVAQGIDASGALLLEMGNGEIRSVISGEARALRLRTGTRIH